MAVAIPVGARADESSFKQIADQAEEFFKASGMDVGKAFAEELAGGMQSAEKAVQRSAKRMADDYDKLADATGKARVEEEKFKQLKESGARNDRLVAQTERVVKARRDESRALRQVIGDLKDYEHAVEDAGSKSFSKGFGAGFSRSHVGGFFSQLKSEAESSGSMAGVLAGRAMGAGITAGLAAGTAGVAAVIGGVGYTLSKGFQRLEGIDQAKFKLKGLGHSGAEVTKIMADAESSVKGTAFALDDAVGAAASAVAAGVKPGEDLTHYLTTIGDTAAIANTSFDEMASIFNKVTTSNKAYTQELRQLADRGIPIFTWLQQAYKVSGEELDKMIQGGAVNAATFRGVIAANIGGAAKEMGQSFSGAVDNMGAAISRLGAAALGAPFESAAGAIGGLTDKVDELKDWLNANQDKVVDFWASLANAAVTGLNAVDKAISGTMTLIGGLLRGMSAFDKFLDHIPGMGGNQAEAAQLDQWADSIFKLRDGAASAGPKLDEFHNSIKSWADDSKRAGQFGRALGGATAEIAGGDVLTGPLPQGPGGPAEKLGGLGFGLERLPDGKVKIVPKTDDATQILDAWRAKQGGDSVKVPARTDFAPSIDSSGGKKDKSPRHFDESEYSLASHPVPGVSAMDVIAGGAPGLSAPGADLGGTVSRPGPGGFYEVDPRRVFDAESSLMNARNRVEEARLRLLELEHKDNVSQSALVSAKHNVLEAERGLQSAQMKLAEAQQGTLKKHTDALKGGLSELGAALDQDFGISKGLPGLAENITKFLANLAFAPALGALQAVVYAGGGVPVGGAGGMGAPMAIAGGMLSPSALGPASMFGAGGYGGMSAAAALGGGLVQTGQPRQYQPGMVPNNVQMLSVLEQMFPGVKMSADTSRRDKFGEHGSGEALDIMVGANAALGRQINEFLLQNADALGLQYTLWQQATWRPDGSVSAMDDRGSPTQNHMDHVHARVRPGPAASGGGFVPLNTPNTGYGAMPYTGGLGVGSAPSVGAVLGGDGAALPAPAAIAGGGGGSGMGVPGIPGMAGPPQGLVPSALSGGTPSAPIGLAPSVGAGGPGAQGVGGMPLDAAMTAASALDVLAPGAGMAAQKGIQLINRAIGYGGQLAGIGVQGLLSTFLPRESPLADMGNSWFGRLASGFAGVRPAGQNMAGVAAMPNPDAQANTGRGQGQGGHTTINNTVNQNNYDRDSDAKAREATEATLGMLRNAPVGPRR